MSQAQSAIDGLSAERRALLEKLLRDQRTAKGRNQDIPRRVQQGPCPLSFSQQLMWISDQLIPQGSTYNVPIPLKLIGGLNLISLQRTLDTILERHEILRTTIRTIEGQPFQFVGKPEPLELPLIAVPGQSEPERERDMYRLCLEAARQPFDLSQDLLLRAKLFRLDPTSHVLLLITHHIAFDGASRKLLFREIEAIYKAFCEGKPSPLQELSIQYADYAVWQRETMKGEVMERHLAYWKEHLAGAPPFLELPADRPRPATQTFRGARQVSSALQPLRESLKKLRCGEGTTLYMIALAAFSVLLYRYTGQETIVIGTPVLGRDRAEVDGLIGYVSNTLALRIDLAGDPTFREFLVRVRDVVLGAFDHQEMPLERLVMELQPARDASRSPLFQVLFSAGNASVELPRLTGLKVSSFKIDRGITKLDLTIALTESQNELLDVCEYSTDLFDYATIARILDHYHTLIESIVTDPDQKISELQMLTEREERQMLIEWNDTRRPYPRDACVHQLFEQQVLRTPTAPAAEFEGRTITYGELNARANHLARYLRSRGAGPESVVGLCVERSLDVAVGMLGILKAGAACLPLDPDYPIERLNFMLTDSGAISLLTQQRLANRIPTSQAEVIFVDTDSPGIGTDGEDDSHSGVTPENVAFVIYTSGSTGEPKGVLLTHRGLVNHNVAAASYFGLNPQDRVLQFASLSFDLALEEMFPTWISGATVVFRPDSLLITGKPFLDWIAAQRITVLDLPTAIWQQWVHELAAVGMVALPDLRLLIVGGDKALASALDAWRAISGDRVRWINTYGPTETSVIAAAYEPPLSGLDVLGNPPIGRPIANMQLYILDRNLRPVPIGVVGELCISGEGVARGYLNRPELTAERFIREPFWGDGSRLYRTGDKARYLADGNVEFLGRDDDQVKIRGFRIELGEIETVLARHPSVQDCVLAACEEVSGDKRLVGYVVPAPGYTMQVADLRNWVKEHLPEHMVPVAWVEMERLPLSPNGKVDRKNLPEPEYARQDLADEYQGARTPAEEVMASIWAEVLKLDQIGVHDQFFELGGHSLLATQVVSRIRQTFEVELPLRALFEAPTVAGLTERVERLQLEQQGLLVPPIRPLLRHNPPPLSFAQQRLWFLDQLDPNSSIYNVSYIVRMKGPLRAEVLEKSLNEIVRRHETLRTSFQMVNDGLVQVIAPNLTLPLVIEDLGSLPQADRQVEARRRAAEEVAKPFDLSVVPLLRATLLRLADDDHVLILNIHHIISDGWSVGLLSQELSALYEALSANRPAPLPELPVQYADYAVWQREFLVGEVLDIQLTFWKQHLAGAPASLDLPTDRPRPPVQTYCGAREMVILPKELLNSIRELSRNEGATLFMTLLAAFNVLLARYSGQQDVVIGTPIAGRNRAEVERLIGFFINTLVVRTDLSGNPSFRELLARVRETAMCAYAHQDLSYEKLVEEIKPNRDLSRNPLFQVMFVLQNVPAASRKMGEIEAAPFATRAHSAKFDLSWTTSEGPNGLLVSAIFNTDLFDADTIRRMLRHYQVLLESAFADPDMRISRLPLLTSQERERVLVEWNATQAEYPGELCVHDLLAQQAHQSPDRVAIVCGARTMSYRDLHQRSNQLARYLQKHGVGPGVLVGLMVDRSPDLLVALLGIMKAGGAYVPLDPAYPKDRIHLILEDSAAPVILTDQALADTLPDSAAEAIYLDTLWPAIAHECADDLPRSVGSENLAYVLYTSGSTGKPKGVQIEHRSVVNFLASMQRQPGLAADDVLLAVTTISFDIAGLELFLPLVTGAEVALASREQAADPVQLQALLASSKATVMQATPATWRMMLESGWTGNPGLKVLCGGEAFPPDLSNQLVPRCNELWNMYGPTETTIWSSVYRVDSELAQTAPIGRPISNTTMYVLDSRGEPVPTGVLGELYIGGAGLARGYQNLPDFTAERFVASPFEPGKRLYRTGDLASYLPDGNLRFHGRADFQVKIRGFRIELGEIETVLAKHASVERVVVAVRESRPGEQMLVAYIVPKPEQDVVPAELRAHLEQSLPGYMSPAAFVKLDELPLTDNGKINRRALPAPEWSRLETVSKTAPRDQLELILVRIWQRVLHLSSVGVDDNFFDLGGHSLLAVRLLSEVEKVVGRKIPLASLFRGSTVASLAKILREGSESDPEPLVVEFQAGNGTTLPLFAVAAPGTGSLGYALLARHLGEDQAFYKVQAPNSLEGGRPLGLQEQRALAQQYVAGMRAVQPQGPYFLAAMCIGCHIAEQMILQLEAQGQEVGMFAIFDTWPQENTRHHRRSRLFTMQQQLRSMDFRESVHWIRRAVGNRIQIWTGKIKATQQPWDEIYWPQNFVPTSFRAPILLFKRPKQPYCYIDDPLMGWGVRSKGGVEIHEINTTHYELLREPHLQYVSKVLLAHLQPGSSCPEQPDASGTAANTAVAIV